MKARIVYIEPEKARKINDLIAAEKEFLENLSNGHEKHARRKTY